LAPLVSLSLGSLPHTGFSGIKNSWKLSLQDIPGIPGSPIMELRIPGLLKGTKKERSKISLR